MLPQEQSVVAGRAIQSRSRGRVTQRGEGSRPRDPLWPDPSAFVYQGLNCLPQVRDRFLGARGRAPSRRWSRQTILKLTRMRGRGTLSRRSIGRLAPIWLTRARLSVTDDIWRPNRERYDRRSRPGHLRWIQPWSDRLELARSLRSSTAAPKKLWRRPRRWCSAQECLARLIDIFYSYVSPCVLGGNICGSRW